MVDILNSQYSPLLAQALSQQARVKAYGDVRDNTKSPLAAGLASYLAAKQGITANNTLADLLGKNADIERADKERAFKIQENAANLSGLTTGLQIQELMGKQNRSQALSNYLTGKQPIQPTNTPSTGVMQGISSDGEITPQAFDAAATTQPIENMSAEETVIDLNQPSQDELMLAQFDPEAALKLRVERQGKTGEKKIEQFKNTSELRKEFSNESKAFKEVGSAFNRIQSSQDSAQGDIALIFNYMKMLDPGSTVREGEFATAEQAAGVPTRILQQYNKAINGERLTPDMRGGFLSQSTDLYKAAEGQQINLENQYKTLAEMGGFKPEAVITNFKITPKTDAAKQGATKMFEGFKIRQKGE